MADLKILIVVVMTLLVLKNGAFSCSLHRHTSTSTSSSVSDSTLAPLHTPTSCGSSTGKCPDGLNQITGISPDSTSILRYNSAPVSPVPVSGLPVTPLSSSSLDYEQLYYNYLSNYLSLPIGTPVSLPFPSSNSFDSSQPLPQWSLYRPIPSSEFPSQQIAVPISINMPDIEPESVPVEVLSPVSEITTTTVPIPNNTPISAPNSHVIYSTDIAGTPGSIAVPTSGILSQSIDAPDRSIPSTKSPQQITIPISINVPDIKPESIPVDVLSPVTEKTTTAIPISNNIPVSPPISTNTNSTNIVAPGPNEVPA